ncbi:MAG: hypothetical protein D6812_05920 [Deltaproteobacteria bacterium]|nr:MAG: hypothetical protein D6812_05920 [Deltaproteobacteria bacterium]
MTFRTIPTALAALALLGLSLPACTRKEEGTEEKNSDTFQVVERAEAMALPLSKGEAQSRQLQGSIFQLIPEKTEIVVAIDMAAIQRSAFFKAFSEEGETGEVETKGGWEEVRKEFGIDPGKDIDQISFSAAIRPEHLGKEGKDPEFSFVLSGHFRPEEIDRALRGQNDVRITTEGDVTYYHFTTDSKVTDDLVPGVEKGLPSSGEIELVIADSTTLLLGTGPRIRELVALRKGKGKPFFSTERGKSFLREVDPSAAIWGFMTLDQIPQTTREATLEKEETLGPMGKNLLEIESISFAIDISEIFGFELGGTTTTEAGSRQIADLLRGLTALLRLSAAQDSPALTRLLDHTRIEQQDRHFRIVGRITAEDTRNVLRDIEEKRKSASSTGSASPSKPSSPQPSSPSKREALPSTPAPSQP